MIDYHVAIRGALFDIARVCDNADDIALNARFIEDGLLFIRDGKIRARMTGRRENNIWMRKRLHRQAR